MAETFDFLAPAQGPDEIGRLGGYRVLKLLGEGGMGMVFKAEDVNLSRLVALKVMRPEQAKNPSARERFLREAKATAAVKHDHIVSIYQVGEDRSIPFIAMEFLQGEPLDGWLKKNTPTISQALKVGREIARGLSAAHERGLIHRDIKPANIWLEAPGGRVKILDFGLARTGKEDKRLTQAGAILGTPAFMSPEQACADRVDARTDLFSLGCILYRLCTGVMPFQGDSVTSLLLNLATVDPTLPQEINPEIPPALADLVMKLLAKKPDDRPTTAKAVVEAIQAFEKATRDASVKSQAAASVPAASPFADMIADAGQDQAGRSSRLQAAAAPRSRRKLLIAALVILLLGGGGLLAWTAWQHWDEGTLVVESDDPDIRLTVKQGDKMVTIVEPKTRKEIELKSGAYDLALVDDTKGLRLSTKQFTLARGGREVVKVSLESAATKKPEPQPSSIAQPTKKTDPKPEPKVRLEPKPEPQPKTEPRQEPKPENGSGTTVTNSTGMKLVLIPPGKFLMGSPSDEKDRKADEGPRHEVEITKPFYMGAYEVTQEEYNRVIGSNPSHFARDKVGQDTSRFPVDNVTYKEAVEFCRKLSESPEEKRAGRTYRLPTEAEWEYACRAGTTTVFHYGNSLFSGQANFDGNQPYGGAVKGKHLGKTAKVGSYEPNAFGLHDMHGNVWEWCADRHEEGYYASSPNKDPQGPDSGSRRVLRGGSWSNPASSCRAASRLPYGPGDRRYYLGFRVVCPISPANP